MIIQDQILSLLLELQRDFGMSMILVSHDLGVIAEMCDRIAVMYGGQIVELTDARTLLTEPRHPYTISLLRSLPDAERKSRYLLSIPGTPPRLVDVQPGCRFAERCPLATIECRDVGHRAARRRPTGHLVALPAPRRRKEARGMAKTELRVGVIGAGRWANMAHLPGWQRDPRCELVAVCDVDARARREGAPRSSASRRGDRRLPARCSSATTST